MIETGLNIRDGVPSFKRKFIRYQADESPIEILEIVDADIVKLRTEDDVAAAIATWARTFEKDAEGWKFEQLRFPKFCLEVAKSWAMAWAEEGVLRTLPPAIRFKSEKGLCFSRLPFDLTKGAKLEHAPTWAECLSRMTNSEAFAMRIGSLFDPTADRKQAAWLWGESDNGKSIMVETIGRMFKGAYAPMQSFDTKDAFFMRTLVGKRMAYINECSIDFLTSDSSRFKSITGESRHLINRKGKDHFVADLEVILFMSSNPEPTAKELAVANRLITCHVEPIPDGRKLPPHIMAQKLNGEMKIFLSWAHDLYLEKRLPNGRIPSDQSRLLERMDSLTSPPMEFLHSNFVFEPGSAVLATRMKVIMKEKGEWRGNNRLHEWIDAWVKGDKAGNKIVYKRVPTKEAGKLWFYNGIREKREHERQVSISE